MHLFMKKRTLAEIKAQLPKWRQMEENNQHTWLLHIIACFFFDYGLATTPENWPLCDMIQQMNDFQEKAGYLSAEMYQIGRASCRERV